MTTLLAKKACLRCLHTCQQVTAFCVWSLSLRVHYCTVLYHLFFSPTCYTPWSVFQDGMIEVYPNRYLLCLLPKNSYVCGLFPACISSRHYSYLHHLTAASSLVVPSLYAKSALLSISLCFLFHSFPPLCQLFLLPFNRWSQVYRVCFFWHPITRVSSSTHTSFLSPRSSHSNLNASCFFLFLHPPIRSLWPISHSVV